MTQRPLLPIGDFAVATSLSAQTLRYYHSEGLLVPAEIDEDTGYRAYTFDQVHRALVLVTLRAASMSIRDIRAVLDAPDLLTESLAAHREALERQRGREDAAMTQAARLADGWPTGQERGSAAATAATRRVPRDGSGPDGSVIPQQVRDAADGLERELAAAGIETSGPAWAEYALDTAEDKANALTSLGPDWTVAVDLAEPGGHQAPLPADTGLVDRGDRRELVVLLPAVPTMVTVAAALDHLTTTSLEQGLVPDLGRPRYLLGPDHVTLALAVEPCPPG